MENIISNDDRVAIAEVDYIIHHMNEKYINKIPQKILDYITILKKRNVEIYVDPKLPLENQGLKEFTLYFLMILNLRYWCNDERRKEILAMMENNQKEIDDRVNSIFEQANSISGDSDSILNSSEELSKPKDIVFANKENEILEEVSEGTDIVSKKTTENFLIRIINKIKSIFLRK